MAVTASVQPESARIVYRIRLPASVSGSVFPKNAWIILRKTDPDPIWMAWSGFGPTHPVWKQAGMQESSGPVSGRTQPARYQFPTFRLCSVLPQTSRMISYKPIPGPIWFWLFVSGFGQTDPLRKQAGVQESFWPASGQCFPSDPDRMRIGSGIYIRRIR